MKRLAILLVAILFVSMAHAQLLGKHSDVEITTNEWANREITSVNRLAVRTNIVAYSDENAIEHRKYENSPYYVSLNGKWLVDVSKGVGKLNEKFEAKTFSTDGWQEVTVPSNKLLHNGVVMKTPKILGVEDMQTNTNFVATYYKEFNVPKAWSDYEAVLCLQAKSAYYVWVNFKCIGYAEDSRTISEFDITPYLNYGKTNNVMIQVVGASTGNLLEMNYPSSYNGITGNVAINLVPVVHVRDFKILSDYEIASGAGLFNIDIDVTNNNAKGKYYVEVELWNPSGRAVEKMGRWIVFDKRKEVSAKLDRSILDVYPWSAESPSLYTAVVRIRDERMNVIETVGTRFGFRHIEMNNGVMQVNGQDLTMRGVVYNNYMHQNGGELTREQIKKDIALMKQSNINAIRTRLMSPAADYLYEMCDEYGMYVVCDANIAPYNGTSKSIITDNEYADLFIDRVNNMYDHYKNYPSIIAWSLGDAEGNGICMESAYKALKQKDNMRLVIYAGAEYSENTDIIAAHITNEDVMNQYLAKQQTRPMILIGYSATQGNGFGDIENSWQLIRQNRRMQGGFLEYWNDGCEYDQNLSKDIVKNGLRRSDGRVAPFIEELRELYRDFDFKIVNKSIGAIEFNITNYSNFATSNDYQVIYNIYSNLKPRIIEGDVSVDLAPGESKNFKLKIPKLTLYADEDLFIKFSVKQKEETELIPRGTVLSNKCFALPMESKKRQPLPEYGRVALEVSHVVDETLNKAENGIIIVGNDNFEMKYDLDRAEIINFTSNGVDILQSSPNLNFWREPTYNDKLDKNGSRLWQQLNDKNIHREVVATNYRKLDDYTVGIDVMLRYCNQNDATLMDVKQTLQVLYTGDIIINNEIVVSELIKGMPKVGMQFVLNNAFDTVEWYGMDKETYVDRNQSGLLGMYSKPVEKMSFDYGNNQESGNRTNVHWSAVRNAEMGVFFDMLDTLYNFSVKPVANGILVNIDYNMTGIGNAISGTPIAEKYLISDKKINFEVHFRPYNCYDYAARDFCLVKYPEVQSSVLPLPIITKNRDRFDAPMQITIKSEAPQATIRYTLDGSIPNEHSLLYRGPFTINSSSIVKARVYQKGATTSFTATEIFNFDYISSISYENKANTPYNYNVEHVLFDGEVGDVNDLSRGWIGFSGKDFSAVLTLNKSIDLDQVVLRFAHVPDAWVFAPVDVDVYTSSDGVNFDNHVAAVIPYNPADEIMNATQLQTVKVNVGKANVKYVKIVAKNLKRIPNWHKAKGLNAWIMTDEIQLNEVIK